jgi:hypothetical protein
MPRLFVHPPFVGNRFSSMRDWLANAADPSQVAMACAEE